MNNEIIIKCDKDLGGIDTIKGRRLTFNQARQQCKIGLNDKINDFVNLDYCYKGVRVLDYYNQMHEEGWVIMESGIYDGPDLMIGDCEHAKIIDYDYIISEGKDYERR